MVWSQAHAKLHTLLCQRRLLPRDSRILMAVSGGQDSLCLARLLVDLQPKWQWSLAVVHCDHGWREDSGDNGVYVRELSKRWQLPMYLEIASAPPSNEAAARQWRYETFARVARKEHYSYVVTGHTMSDRAETVLFNLTRGTSIDGLGSLPWQRHIDEETPQIMLVRPLLTFVRSETGQFCQKQNIVVWEDTSNQNLAFRRNRIRQELVPYLQMHFNPQVERALAQTAEITAAETDYLETQAQQIYNQTVGQDSSSRIWSVSAPALRNAPKALQRRVIRQLLQKAMAQPPTFLQIEKLITLLSAPNKSQSDPFPSGLIARVQKPLILLGTIEALSKCEGLL